MLQFDAGMGSLLSLIVWFVFGAFLVQALDVVTWQSVVFAVLALTVVRMLPVALVLVRSGLDRSTVAFIGWFGPRGLASVVFALVVSDALTRHATPARAVGHQPHRARERGGARPERAPVRPRLRRARGPPRRDRPNTPRCPTSPPARSPVAAAPVGPVASRHAVSTRCRRPVPPDSDPEEYDKLRRRVLWKMPSGLYVLGSRAGERRNGMTVNWVTQVSFDPKLVAVSVEHEAFTHELLVEGGVFAST